MLPFLKNGSFDVRLLLKVTQKPLSDGVGVNMRPVKKLMCYYKTLQTHSFSQVVAFILAGAQQQMGGVRCLESNSEKSQEVYKK